MCAHSVELEAQLLTASMNTRSIVHVRKFEAQANKMCFCKEWGGILRFYSIGSRCTAEQQQILEFP